MTIYLHRKAGFRTTPQNIGSQFSWEVKKANQPRPPVKTQRMHELERKAVVSLGDTPRKGGSYPASKIQKRTVNNTIFWSPSDGTPGGRKPTGKGGDLGNYSFPLPRYTAAYRASETYIAGDVFDPKQTLFRYDPETLNVIAHEEFERKERQRKIAEGARYKPGKFIPPHDPKSPVYEGLMHREGVKDLGRAWSAEANKGEGNEVGRYFIDLREMESSLQIELKAKLAPGEGIALREHYAIPSTPEAPYPDRMSEVKISPWQAMKNRIFGVEVVTSAEKGENYDREKKVNPDLRPPNYSGVKPNMAVSRLSKTIGGGEQIVGDPGFFKIFKP